MSPRRLVIVGLMLLVTAPAGAQSPSPLGALPPPPEASPIAAPSPTDPPGGTAPLPARIVTGACDVLGESVVDLLGVVAGGPVGTSSATVYASISDLDVPLAELAGQDRVLVVGGEADPESAVACGAITGPAQGSSDLAIALVPLHASPYSGTALFHEADGRTSVYLVVVAAIGPAGPPGASAVPSGSPSGQPGADASLDPADLSPVRSPQPGTSGAPAFSPLPAPSDS